MAFARIITRSHQYAQQLALDLLARGYTVEIVSPDAIPNTPADLELRVEAAAPEAQGQISEIHEGKQARSSEYLQKLKPMMADLLRKWPAGKKSEGENDGDAFSFNAEPDGADEMELPPVQLERRSEPAPPEFESTALISPPAAKKSESAFSLTGEPLMWSESETERGGRSEVWFWRAAVGFAGAALLILVLGIALRRSPAAPAQAVSTEPTQTSSAKAQPATETVLPPNASLATLSPRSAVIAPSARPTTALIKAKPSPAIRRIKIPQAEEVVDGDTTITYFNAKAAVPAKPAAKQGAGIKHYSDLN